MKYLRVYADETGESHFEDVEVPTTLSVSPVSDARVEVSPWRPTEAMLFRRVVSDHPPEVAHIAPARQFVIHLAGAAELEVSNGERRRIGPGDVVLVEDTHGQGHRTRRLGSDERVTIMIALPEPTKPNPGRLLVAGALHGSWRLESWETDRADATTGQPFGPAPQGLLVYAPDGHMSGAMMRADRPPFRRPREHAVEFDAGEPAELAAAFNSFLAYAGRWEIGADGLVRHHIEVASIPGWAGATTLVREARIDGDRLTLRTPPRIVDGVEQRATLRWRRA